MADKKEAPQIGTSSPEVALPAKKGALGKVLKVLGIVLAVTLVECTAMYFYFPSANANPAPAQPATPAESVVIDEEDGKSAASDQAEVKLGEFRVTAYQPLSNTTIRIDFQLYGTIAVTDQEQFKVLMEAKGHRFREQVLVTVRSTDLTDLADAGLGLLKRRILATTNKTLGKPLLHSVVFSDFSFVEQ
jgi:flagellar FliL protein